MNKESYIPTPSEVEGAEAHLTRRDKYDSELRADFQQNFLAGNTEVDLFGDSSGLEEEKTFDQDVQMVRHKIKLKDGIVYDETDVHAVGYIDGHPIKEDHPLSDLMGLKETKEVVISKDEAVDRLQKVVTRIKQKIEIIIATSEARDRITNAIANFRETHKDDLELLHDRNGDWPYTDSEIKKRNEELLAEEKTNLDKLEFALKTINNL